MWAGKDWFVELNDPLNKCITAGIFTTGSTVAAAQTAITAEQNAR